MRNGIYIIGLCLALLACGTEDSLDTIPTIPPVIPPVATVNVTPLGPLTLSVAQTQQFNAVALDSFGATVAGVTFSWQSSTPAVATISSTGIVTAVAPGTANISATAGSITSVSVQIVVPAAVPAVVATVNVTPLGPLTLSVAQTQQFNAVALDSLGTIVAGVTISWQSSTPAVAMISSTGIVTAMAPGTTNITATAGGITSVSVQIVIPSPLALSWVPPTLNEDASLLNDLAGYRIYYGTASGNYSQMIEVQDFLATGYTFSGLSPGTYYLVVTTYDTSGNESVYSTPEVSGIQN